MTLHIASTGVTLLKGLLTTPHGTPGIGDALADEIEHTDPARLLTRYGAIDGPSANALLTGCLSPHGTQPPAQPQPQLREEIERLLPVIDPAHWPSTVSAELDTFTRTPAGRRILSQDDVAVLLATDTAEGLTAALWNAIALAGGQLSRVLYLPDPAQIPHTPRGRVLLVRVPDLDARDEQGFARAMRGLGVLGRTLATRIASPRDEPCRFHLSGGYKATVPYLIGLAEGMRSLPGAGPVEAHVLHESTQGDTIRVPLRRIHPSIVDQLIKSFNGRSLYTGRLGSDELEGYAYDTREHRGSTTEWRLTPFGEGLFALFGRPAEGLGA
ncbi:hypothetical protein ACFXOS_21565 [Streptomyces sp. NPDC059175]|uniref:hypothetical protein n=1 Tax=Streptomyces sp. NPDC059175 TaxID=3346757 RepID=UPI0036B8110B